MKHIGSDANQHNNQEHHVCIKYLGNMRPEKPYLHRQHAAIARPHPSLNLTNHHASLKRDLGPRQSQNQGGRDCITAGRMLANAIEKSGHIHLAAFANSDEHACHESQQWEVQGPTRTALLSTRGHGNMIIDHANQMCKQVITVESDSGFASDARHSAHTFVA